MLTQKKEIRRTKTNLLLVLGLLLVAVLVLGACGTQGEEAAATPIAPAAEEAAVPTADVVGEEEAAVTTPEVVGEEEAAVATPEVVGEEEAAVATPGAETIVTATDQVAIRASELMDYRVKNFQGEDLGEIEDLVIGPHSTIDYAILSFGGFLDIGDKLFAIPLLATTLNTEEDTLFFDVTEESLANAPSFTDDAWPDLANTTWDDNILEFWGTTQEATLAPEPGVAETAGSGPAFVRASELIGDNIRNAAGEDVGEVEDVIVNLDNTLPAEQQMDFAVLSFGGFLDIGDKLFLVPLNHLDLSNPEEEAITFNVDEAMLQTAPSFTDDAWPDLTNPTWGEEPFNFWEGTAAATEPGATTAETTEGVTTSPAVGIVTISVVTNPEPAIRASELIDYRVINLQGEDLGEIEDLVIGLTSGRVRYAVLSFGGFLDIGDKLFPIPLSAMTFNRDENAFVLDVSEERLEDAPGFDLDAWPDLNDPTWDADFRGWENELGVVEGSYIGAGAAGEQFTDEPAIRATELMDFPVRNSQGEDLGEIEDLLIGLDSGRVGFAVLSFGGFLDIGDKLFAIPMNALSFDLQDQVALLEVDEEALENAPSFTDDAWPDLTTPDWDTNYRNFWDQTNMK